jgi:hypothetical protein
MIPKPRNLNSSITDIDENKIFDNIDKVGLNHWIHPTPYFLTDSGVQINLKQYLVVKRAEAGNKDIDITGKTLQNNCGNSSCVNPNHIDIV